MNPHYLGMLTSIGVHEKALKPTWQEIKAKYYAKFRGKKAADDNDEDAGATPWKAPKSASPPPRKSLRLSAAKWVRFMRFVGLHLSSSVDE